MSEPTKHELTLFVAKNLYGFDAKQVTASDDLRSWDGLSLYEGDYYYYSEFYRGFDDLPDYINDFQVIQKIRNVLGSNRTKAYQLVDSKSGLINYQWAQYIAALAAEVGLNNIGSFKNTYFTDGAQTYYYSADEIWRMLAATPEQHCRAYYRVMNERVER
jgi:hypothetical protein